ncbi:IS3 family transposase [Phytoactinopolyspora mesophila]|uniref:IS3 family transposase n=1 Tax=Phytoactinopolyspora mesophila TaxID=2650750 RepID=UPI001390A32B|nr:IS3 family transposase [Phytoactinopolyspora mesophila]
MKRTESERTYADAELTLIIEKIHDDHQGRLGIGRLVVELAKLGRRHSHKGMRRLVHAAGLACVHPRPYKATTAQDAANTATAWSTSSSATSCPTLRTGSGSPI